MLNISTMSAELGFVNILKMSAELGLVKYLNNVY
jgi:hypothetical protein